MIFRRAKLYRYDTTEDPHQWKDRGTGEIKILCHLKQNTARVLMRRDRTWKICANHYSNPYKMIFIQHFYTLIAIIIF